MSQNEQTPDFMWANRFGQFYNTMNGYDEAMAGGTQVYDTDDTLPLSGMLDDEEDDSLKQR